jgi:hypothetical protein
MANEKINEYLDSTTVPDNAAYFGFDNWTGSAFLSTKILWSDLKTALGAVGNLGNIDLIKTDDARYYTFSGTEADPNDFLIFRNSSFLNILTLDGSACVYSNGINNVSSNLFYGSNVGTLATQGKNSVFGVNAISDLTTGLDNVCLGYEAGRYLTNGSTELIDSNCSIFIGSESKALAANSINQIVIGCGVTGHGSNTVTIGTGSTTNQYLFGDVTVDGLAGAGGNVSADVNGKLILGVATDPILHVASFGSLIDPGSTSSVYITDDTDYMYIWDANSSTYKKVGDEDIYSKDGILSDNSRNVQLLLDTSSASLDFKNLSGNSILKIDGARDLFLNNLSAPTGNSYFLKIDDAGKVTSVDFTTGGETLSGTLALGNTTGVNDISIDNGQVIKATNGSSSLDLRFSGTDGKIGLLGDFFEATMGTFFVDDAVGSVVANTGAASLSLFKGNLSKLGQISIGYNDGTDIFSSNLPSYPTILSSQNATVKDGVINSNILGGLSPISKTDNTPMLNQLGFNTGLAGEMILAHTPNAGNFTATLKAESGTIAYLTDVASIYGSDGTTGAGRVVTLTDTLDFKDGEITFEVPQGSFSPLSFYENRVGGANNGDNYSLDFYFNDSSGAKTLGKSIVARVNGVPSLGNVDVDFTFAGQFKVQSNDRVLITPNALTLAPVAQLEVRGDATTSNVTFLSKSGLSTASQIVIWAKNSNDSNLFYIDGVGKSFFNESSLVTGDFQHKGFTDSNLFYSDAGLDRVGIGTATAQISSKLTVTGDVETLGNTDGLIVLDRTNATRYRIYSDGGVLSIEVA